MSNAPLRLEFVQVDVFSSTPLQGNPLAIFKDGRALSDDQMQALAREMNLAETTFVLPRDPVVEKERGIRVRIFTVQEELPFAGHPTLGTAFFLRGETGAQDIALDLNVGKVPVRFDDTPGEPTFGEMTQMDPEFGEVHDAQSVVRCTGLRDGDIDPSLPVQTVSTGVRFIIVPLRGLQTIQNLQMEGRSSAEYLKQCGSKFFYFVTRETVDAAAKLHARMLMYGEEDPASGSAAGCACAWMVQYGLIQPEERACIEQGLEIQRPSKIFVRASRKDDRVVNVRVGGHVVEILQGEVAF